MYHGFVSVAVQQALSVNLCILLLVLIVVVHPVLIMPILVQEVPVHLPGQVEVGAAITMLGWVPLVQDLAAPVVSVGICVMGIPDDLIPTIVSLMMMVGPQRVTTVVWGMAFLVHITLHVIVAVLIVIVMLMVMVVCVRMSRLVGILAAR